MKKSMIKKQNVSLSHQSKEIILGSLLGDGSLRIHKPYKNARFSFRHSIEQKDYFWWKVKKLQEISTSHNVFFQKSDGFSDRRKLRFQSQALECLTALYRITHKSGRLLIRRKWLNQMSLLSLAIWWFDDGSLIANGRKGVLCTDGFSEDSQKILARYLKVVWQITVHIGKFKRRKGDQREYYRLWFRSTDELKKFLRLILPYTPVASMLKKVTLLYKDQELQQRWISEILNSTAFPRQTIENVIKEKKTRWKNFRE